MRDRRKTAEEALRDSEATLAQAGQLARLGSLGNRVFQLGEPVHDNRLRWSEQVFRIFGYLPDAVEATPDLFFSHVHPDDRQLVADAVTHAMTHKQPYSIEHRILRADGVERVVREHAQITFDIRGRALRMIGAVQDVTEAKAAEEALAAAKLSAERADKPPSRPIPPRTISWRC